MSSRWRALLPTVALIAVLPAVTAACSAGPDPAAEMPVQVAASVMDQYLSMANMRAAAAGYPTSLDDVEAAFPTPGQVTTGPDPEVSALVGDGSQMTGTPRLERGSDSVTVTIPVLGRDVTCEVRIVDEQAVGTC